VDHATRVIGYLKRVSNFSSGRQKEHTLRHYHLGENKYPKNSNGSLEPLNVLETTRA
jgi:hypothetical protein